MTPSRNFVFIPAAARTNIYHLKYTNHYYHLVEFIDSPTLDTEEVSAISNTENLKQTPTFYEKVLRRATLAVWDCVVYNKQL